MPAERIKKVIVGNCEAWGGFGLARSDWEKSAYKTLRWISYAQSSEDIVISHLPVSEEYLAYRRSVCGFAPEVLSPGTTGTTRSLTRTILEDPKLLETLIAKLSGNNKYELHFALLTEDSETISNKLEIPIAKPDPTQVNNGLLNKFNSKIEFIHRCCRLGLPTPGGEVARGSEGITKVGRHILTTHTSLMLRRAQGANCLGVKPLVSVSMESLHSAVDSLGEEWLSEDILVEPLLSLASSPCTLGFIGDDGSASLVVSGDQLFADSAYCWISPCPCAEDIKAEMEVGFLRYAESVSKDGARGWLDIDWGITMDRKLIGIESNYRMTGWTAMSQLIRTCYENKRDSYPMLFSSDVLPLRDPYTFRDLANKLSDQLCDDIRSPGVVITSAPNNKFIGLAILGTSHEDIYSIMRELRWLTPTFDEFALVKGVLTSN